MEIHQIVFRKAVLRASEAPRDPIPHVAVAGRSNVGKSSLLNWLCRQNVAKVAKAPGKTRTLNFFLVDSRFFLVDLPGYGYAKVGADLRRSWQRELGWYLRQEPRLAGVMALIDIRHGPTEQDLQLQELLLAAAVERLVVLTKADKVGRGARAGMQQQVQRQLALVQPPPVTSIRTGEGRREILDRIDALLTRWRQRQQRSD